MFDQKYKETMVNLYVVCKTFLFYLLIHFYALLSHHQTLFYKNTFMDILYFL